MIAVWFNPDLRTMCLTLQNTPIRKEPSFYNDGINVCMRRWKEQRRTEAHLRRAERTKRGTAVCFGHDPRTTEQSVRSIGSWVKPYQDFEQPQRAVHLWFNPEMVRVLLEGLTVSESIGIITAGSNSRSTTAGACGARACHDRSSKAYERRHAAADHLEEMHHCGSLWWSAASG